MFDTEIFDGSMRAALQLEVMNRFPNHEVYREATSSPVFPHWFIQQLTLSQREDRRNRWFLNYFFTLIHRVVAEVPMEPNIQQRLDSAMLGIMDINEVYLGMYTIKVRNARSEKVDGTLHYFCNFDFQVTKPMAEYVKMRYLILNKELK